MGGSWRREIKRPPRNQRTPHWLQGASSPQLWAPGASEGQRVWTSSGSLVLEDEIMGGGGPCRGGGQAWDP